MKKILFIPLVAAMALFLFLGVKTDNVVYAEEEYPEGTYTLYAGQNTPVGHVDVWNDYKNIYVKYVMDDGWCLTETHLHLIPNGEEFPVNKAGNPKIGHFDYKETHDCADNYLYNTIENQPFIPNDLYDIAAHAKVRSVSEQLVEETIYSDTETLYNNEIEWTETEIVPDDKLHSQWIAKRTFWDMESSNWLWDGEYTNLLTQKTVEFLRKIEIPGEPFETQLRATADNSLAVSLNGDPEFTDGSWTHLEERSLTFNEGENEIKFDVTNASGGDWVGNPGGLLYELEYSYYPFIYESAWAEDDGINVVGKGNWATYFKYTIQAPENTLLSALYEGYCYTFGTDANETLTLTFEHPIHIDEGSQYIDFQDASKIGNNSSYIVWDAEGNVLTITTQKGFGNPRPEVGDYVTQFYGITDDFHNSVIFPTGGVEIQGNILIPSVEGTWQLSSNRFVQITNQGSDGLISGFLTEDAAGDYTFGTIAGDVSCSLEIDFRYDRTDVADGYFAIFDGTLSEDWLSASGTRIHGNNNILRDGDGQPTAWSMTLLP